MSCLTGSLYSMTADIYEQITEEKKSGQIKRVWNYGTPVMSVSCDVAAITSGGLASLGSTERWAANYENIEYANLWTTERLSKRYRVGNIRDGGGKLIWQNDSLVGVVFNVEGSVPLIDALSGEVTDFKSLLKMAESD